VIDEGFEHIASSSLFARAVHHASLRADAVAVAIDTMRNILPDITLGHNARAL
jgi:hypothetical protein